MVREQLDENSRAMGKNTRTAYFGLLRLAVLEVMPAGVHESIHKEFIEIFTDLAHDILGMDRIACSERRHADPPQAVIHKNQTTAYLSEGARSVTVAGCSDRGRILPEAPKPEIRCTWLA